MRWPFSRSPRPGRHARAFRKRSSENGYSLPVLFDDRGASVDFRILSYPTTLYLDGQGMIQFSSNGFDPVDYERQVSLRVNALRSQ